VSLLHEIQEAVVDPKSELGPILLKLRLLADRLGSHQLEEWVRHESEGYPAEMEVPDYRHVPVTYTGNFANIAWQATNQPIPPALIQKHAGKGWTTQKVRESVSAIDGLLSRTKDGQPIGIDASNLVMILQGKIYEDMACSSISGNISSTAFQEILNRVRNRALELTMRIAKEVPDAAKVTIGKPIASEDAQHRIDQVVHLTVHGPNTMVTNTGAQANINVKVEVGDQGSVVDQLTKAGIPKEAAEEFALILADDGVGSSEKPLGEKAKAWVGDMMPKIMSGAWGITAPVAVKLLEDAARGFLGLD